jgi:peptidoglycan hydrolase CwlO-like protein
MSLKASDQIRILHSIIGALLEHVCVLDDAEQKAKAAQSQLYGVLREYEGAIKRLEIARAELAKTEADLKAKKHLIHDEAARSLAETTRQLVARQSELAALKGN